MTAMGLVIVFSLTALLVTHLRFRVESKNLENVKTGKLKTFQKPGKIQTKIGEQLFLRLVDASCCIKLISISISFVFVSIELITQIDSNHQCVSLQCQQNLFLLLYTMWRAV